MPGKLWKLMYGSVSITGFTLKNVYKKKYDNLF